MKVDNVIISVVSCGQRALVAGFDVESVYYNVPVHSDDRYLLGMKWGGNYFMDLALPFGLHTALFIFSSIADLLVGFSGMVTVWEFYLTQPG